MKSLNVDTHTLRRKRVKSRRKRPGIVWLCHELLSTINNDYVFLSISSMYYVLIMYLSPASQYRVVMNVIGGFGNFRIYSDFSMT